MCAGRWPTIRARLRSRARSPTSSAAGRSRSSIPVRSMRPHRRAARGGARRDRDAYLRHPYPSRSFPRSRASRLRPVRRCSPKDRTAPRARSMSASCRASMPATTPTFVPTARSPTASRSAQAAGPSRRSPRPAIPPTTWRSRCARPYSVLGRSRHGLVNASGGAARRGHERLHGLAAKAGAARRGHLPARPRWPVRDAPRFVEHYIRHRQVASAPSCIAWPWAKPISELGAAIYVGLDPRLVKAAGLSVLAHLEDLDGARSGRGGRPGFDRRALPLAVEGQRLPQCMKCRDALARRWMSAQ